MSKKVQNFLIDLQRRRFMKQSVVSMTGATLALTAGRKNWYAWADNALARPFMINIHLPGGWDTNWFHMAYPKRFVSDVADNPNLIAGHTAASYDLGFSAPPAAGVAGSDPFGRSIDVDSNGAITQYYHGRYTERTISDRLARHPGAQGSSVASAVAGQHHFFGAGAQLAFSGATETAGMLGSGTPGAVSLNLFNKVCIWKGIYSGGAHNVPNRNIIHGSESQYAISYSGLIAEALAFRYGKLQLNYLQLTTSPTEYGANWALSKGDQVPINCADHASLLKLTRRGEYDFKQASTYSVVNDAIGRLGSQIGKEKFSLSKSKEVYGEFMRFFKGALDISELGSNMTSFLSTWQAYANYAIKRVRAMHDPTWIRENISPELVMPFRNAAFNYHLYTPYIEGLTPIVKPKNPANPTEELPFPTAVDASKSLLYEYEIGQVVAGLAGDFDATEASLDIAGNTPRGAIAKMAWKFAMAEFMVVRGYSSVVDMLFGTNDHHADNQNEFRLLTTIYSLYALLLQRLNETRDLSGKSYLDRTLVNMFSEFDRTANLATDTSTENRGTGHDATESILMAGYGVQQGKVFGDRRYGSSGGPAEVTYTLSDSEGKLETRTFAPATFTFLYVFPTIMKIFNVPIPANQITDAAAVMDVIA